MGSLRQELSELRSATTSNVAGTDAIADSKAVSSGTRASSVSASTATALLTQNLNKKNVNSVQNSDAGTIRISTAGDYAIAGVLYTKTASSAVFTLAGTTLTSSQACMFLLALDSAGSGQVTQGNIAAASGACSLPATPAGQCPVGQVVLVAGASQHVPGTTTFSETISAGGSCVITDLMRRS